MKLKEWFKAAKERREAKKAEKRLKELDQKLDEAEKAAEDVRQTERELERRLEYAPPQVKPLDTDTSEIIPPETRFTEEYKEFLKKQQAAASVTENVREEK